MRYLLVAIALIIQALFAVQSQAQTTGSNYGRVSDPSDAAVNGPNVTVKSLLINQTRTASTDQDGGPTVHCAAAA